MDYIISSLVALFTILISSLIFIIRRKGICFWKRYLLTLIYLHFHKTKETKKLSYYPKLKDPDASPVDLGLIPSPFEHEVENPSKVISSSQCDGIHFFGTDFEQNMIDISINKISETLVTTWLYLRLSNGDRYTFPFDLDSRQAFTENQNLFTSCGIQIRCLSPLRKWRISFNGLLRKNANINTSNENIELVHVKFSFVWLAMTLVEELNINYNAKELARAYAEAQNTMNVEEHQRLKKLQNRYEQWGQLLGTLNVEDHEKELYLWSIRTRILTEPSWNEDINVTKFYIYLESGIPIKIETLSINQVIYNFTKGYAITGGGAIKNISECDFNIDKLNESLTSKLVLNFKSDIIGRKNLTLNFFQEEFVFNSGPTLKWSTLFKPFNVCTHDGDKGFGILHWTTSQKNMPCVPTKLPPLILRDTGIFNNKKTILPLNDNYSKSSKIAGGKGCSLALLSELSEKNQLFHVPKGFVITTVAFTNHIRTNKNLSLIVKQLQDVSCQKVDRDLKQECIKCVEEFSSTKLSQTLKEEIECMIANIYGSIENVRFSIRSSAVGEDSDDLSAAGQMLTVLGIRGINNIVDAIVKCWASKFGYEAVQYARQNGQSINSPMAVIVQEMVPSEISGVLFTVNPVNGNPKHPYITANYGLGESVVSSLAEPDTIVLERNCDNTVNVNKIIIGSKKTQVFMKDENGTEEKQLNDNSEESCLSNDWAIKIGNVGLFVENCFCGPRDIEWAISGRKLFLLQARPITTLHNETDFELIHDQDTPMRSNDEYWTRANTGEVFLGATSPLGISVIVQAMDVYGHKNNINNEQREDIAYCPYYFHTLPTTHKQITLTLIDTLFRSNAEKITSFQKAFEIALFGRIIANEEMRRVGVKKYGYLSKKHRLFGFYRIFKYSYMVPSAIKMVEEKIQNHKIPFKTFINAAKTLDGLYDELSFYNEISRCHGLATVLSTFYNLIVMTILAKGKKDFDNELYCDFGILLSSCTSVESAEVPQNLQDLAKAIAENGDKTFSTLPPKVACDLLQNDTGIAGKLFKNFLKKHGHRCVKEFDIYSKSWGMKPEELIPTLQNMVVSPSVINFKHKENLSIGEALKKIKTPLPIISKMILKIVLPWSRNAVGEREKTKSLLIKVVDGFRQICNHLGKLMVYEGLLPSKDLVFFLTLDEIKEILDTQRPGLIQKAIRRHRLHSKLDVLQFPEIIHGIPKPISQKEEVNLNNSTVLKGTPVCQGIVKAPARVILSLEEACTIKSGDILVTHSTDIGWSPYFPLLSGVVTVLGGLISHGAVVAREYGLPCVVGVQNATSLLKSGEIIILNGTEGTVSKVLPKEI